MRRLLIAAVIVSALGVRIARSSPSAGNGFDVVPVDATVRAGVVELTHAVQPWISDSNAEWSGNYVRRYNRGVTRWPASWTQTSIQFDAQCTTVTFSDRQFAVVVDGSAVATVTVPGDTIVRTYTVSISPSPSGSTVEVWDPWHGKPGAQNQGADGPVEACYVVAARLPFGTTMPHPTATTAIIAMGDSIVGARVPIAANAPQVTHGVAGQLRFLAEAKGWLFGDLDYGGATFGGDGMTAANYVTWIQETVAALGSPTTVIVWIQVGHNDYADYGGTVSTSPSALATIISTIASSLPSYSFVISTPPPATSSGANGGGFTLASYGTAQMAITGSNIISKVDTSTCGISTSTDLGDGVHFNDSGVAKDLACLRGSFGL